MPTTEHFVCKTCDIDFDTPSGLGQHVAVAHQECSVCGDVLDDVETLDEHTQQSH
jgi:hypothetical protein